MITTRTKITRTVCYARYVLCVRVNFLSNICDSHSKSLKMAAGVLRIFFCYVMLSRNILKLKGCNFTFCSCDRKDQIVT